jgi:hypothetical protein
MHDRLKSEAAWLALAWLGAALCTGCGAQILGGLEGHGEKQARPVVLDLGTRFIPVRSSGAYLGADALFTFPPLADTQFRLRHIALAGGYRWLRYPFAVELGPQLGAGKPAFEAWNEAGMYLGFSESLLWRVSGDHDSLVGYAPAGVLIDWVMGGSVGVWSRPRISDSNAWDLAFMLGFRFTFISDLFVPSKQGWVPP